MLDRQQQAEAAMRVAVEHAAVAGDPHVLCRMATVCSSWRAAALAAGTPHMEVCLAMPWYLRDQDKALRRLSSFADWLPGHAAVVRSLHISGGRSVSKLAIADTAAQLLGLSLAASARRPLRLHSFRSDTWVTARMVQALPASLTSLKLAVDDACAHDHSEVLSQALSTRLTGLVHLDLSWSSSRQVPLICVLAVASLAGLASLVLQGHIDQEALEGLQQVLCKLLPLRTLTLGLQDRAGTLRAVLLDLSACTTLQKLTLHEWQGYHVRLPLQLESLSLNLEDASADMLAGLHLTALRRLTQLDILCGTHGLVEASIVPDLKRLTHLVELTLSYSLVSAAADDAAAWGRLPRLTGLVIHEITGSRRAQLAPMLEGLPAAAGSLTCLVLCVSMGDDDDNGAAMHWSQTLAHLTKLQSLVLACYDDKGEGVAAGDCLHLTALRALTHLHLAMGDAVGDMVATALACHLRQLCSLTLRDAGLATNHAFPAIGTLQHLTRLDLDGNEGYTPASLMLLTGLSNLQRLGDARSGLSPADLERFWAAVRAAPR